MKNKLLLLIVFILSIYLRLDAYLINNSFFTDEILLAQNIFERDYLTLIFPLKYFQSAPVLFLFISKFISNNIGITELILRFIPFISALGSLFVFYKITNKLYTSHWIKAAVLLTFGINYQLLFYTQCFKQYSSDVLCGLIILYLSLTIENLTKRKYLLLGLCFAILFLFSFPAIFFIAAFTISRLIYFKKYKSEFLLSLVFPIISIIPLWLFNLRYTSHSDYLLSYWHRGFELFHSEIWLINFDFLFYDYKFPLLLIILLIAGAYFLYKKNKFYFINLCSIIVLPLLAALLKLYPFERRLILFILPVLILLSFYSIEDFKRYKTCFLVGIIIFFSIGWFNFGKDFVSSNITYLRQDVKPLLNKINKNDKLYLYYGSFWTYNYYAQLKNLPIDNIILPSTFDENNSDKVLEKDLYSLSDGVYQLFFVKGTHTYDKDMRALDKFLSTHTPIEDIKLKQTRLVTIILGK